MLSGIRASHKIIQPFTHLRHSPWRRSIAFALLLLAALPAVGAELEIPLLQAGRQSFTNVVVTRQTETHLFIMHDGGMATVKVSDLDTNVQSQFGLNVRPAGPSSETDSGKPSPGSIGLRANGLATTGILAVAGLLPAMVGVWYFWNRSRNRAMDPGPPPESDLPYHAAKASLFAPVMVVVVGMVLRASNTGLAGSVVHGLTSMALIFIGFICGIYALWSMKRYGRHGILGKALVGTLINGLLIAVMVIIFLEYKELAERVKREQAGQAVSSSREFAP